MEQGRGVVMEQGRGVCCTPQPFFLGWAGVVMGGAPHSGLGVRGDMAKGTQYTILTRGPPPCHLTHSYSTFNLPHGIPYHSKI